MHFFTAYSFFTVMTHLNKPPYTHSLPLLPLKMYALHVLGSKETFINNFLIILLSLNHHYYNFHLHEAQCKIGYLVLALKSCCYHKQLAMFPVAWCL